MTKIYLSLTFAVLLIITGCSDGGKKKYEQVKRLNSKAVYEKFIIDNYSSKYADSALFKIQEIEFAEASTITDFEIFLQKHPDSKLIKTVNSKLQLLKAQEAEKRKQEAERREQESQPCYGIKLEKYWDTGNESMFGSGGTSIYVRVRNNTNRTKIVYFSVLCNDVGWDAIDEGIKVYPNDVIESKILWFSYSNYGGKIKIRRCE
jgi:hypothetical protein